MRDFSRDIAWDNRTRELQHDLLRFFSGRKFHRIEEPAYIAESRYGMENDCDWLLSGYRFEAKVRLASYGDVAAEFSHSLPGGRTKAGWLSESKADWIMYIDLGGSKAHFFTLAELKAAVYSHRYETRQSENTRYRTNFYLVPLTDIKGLESYDFSWTIHCQLVGIEVPA